MRSVDSRSLIPFFCMILIHLFGLKAQASLNLEGEGQKLRALMNSKSLIELNRSLNQISNQSLSYKICLKQLKYQKIPGHCYLFLNESKDFGLFKEEREKLTIYIDRNCRKATGNLKTLEEVNYWLRLPGLSDDCLAQLKRRNAVLRYKWNESRPELIFQADLKNSQSWQEK